MSKVVILTPDFLCAQRTCKHLATGKLTFAPRVKQDVNRILMAVANSPIILQLCVYIHLPLPHDGISCRCDLDRWHNKMKSTTMLVYQTISYNCCDNVYFQTDWNTISSCYWRNVINKLHGPGKCAPCWCSPSLLQSVLVRSVAVISIQEHKMRTLPSPH